MFLGKRPPTYCTLIKGRPLLMDLRKTEIVLSIVMPPLLGTSFSLLSSSKSSLVQPGEVLLRKHGRRVRWSRNGIKALGLSGEH